MKTRLGAFLVSFCLLGTFFFPSIHQWMHLTDNHHEERICSETKTHFHESELSCALIFVFTTPFTLVALAPTTPLVEKADATKITKYTQELFSSETSHILLRGPPSLLFFV